MANLKHDNDTRSKRHHADPNGIVFTKKVLKPKDKDNDKVKP